MHPSESSLPGTATTWTLDGHRAQDPRPGATAAIDLDAARDGIRLGSGEAADTILGLDLQPQWRLVDRWLRGGDVTVVYESADARHLRTTAMWRLHPCRDRVRGWQAIVSAQTSLLPSDSIRAVTSTVAATPGDEWRWGERAGGGFRWRRQAHEAATAVLLRRGAAGAAGRHSMLVAGHPGEVRGLEAREAHGRVTIACWLFSPELEKGVLLRSRVLAALGPAVGDEAWAAEAATAFAALPPMLTT
jgi:hypothetical protein